MCNHCSHPWVYVTSALLFRRHLIDTRMKMTLMKLMNLPSGNDTEWILLWLRLIEGRNRARAVREDGQYCRKCSCVLLWCCWEEAKVGKLGWYMGSLLLSSGKTSINRRRACWVTVIFNHQTYHLKRGRGNWSQRRPLFWRLWNSPVDLNAINM